jgi:hydrogenase-1 operon protein HyaF
LTRAIPKPRLTEAVEAAAMSSNRPFPDPVDAARRFAAGGGWVGGRFGARDGPASRPAGDASTLVDARDITARPGALALLRRVRQGLADRLAGQVPAAIDLAPLAAADLALVDRVLGEGEVAAQVQPLPDGAGGLQAQESVFAGVWRVRPVEGGGRGAGDTVEIGPVPQGLLDAAQLDVATLPAPQLPHPADLMNAPAVVEELVDRSRRWRPASAAHVINLTLLPLSAGDMAYLDARLGAGRVVILSGGHALCRIVNTRLPRVWRVTYFGTGQRVILDMLEVGPVPEVACAATQDLEDSAERLDEWLAWAEAW